MLAHLKDALRDLASGQIATIIVHVAGGTFPVGSGTLDPKAEVLTGIWNGRTVYIGVDAISAIEIRVAGESEGFNV